MTTRFVKVYFFRSYFVSRCSSVIFVRRSRSVPVARSIVIPGVSAATTAVMAMIVTIALTIPAILPIPPVLPILLVLSIFLPFDPNHVILYLGRSADAECANYGGRHAVSALPRRGRSDHNRTPLGRGACRPAEAAGREEQHGAGGLQRPAGPERVSAARAPAGQPLHRVCRPPRRLNPEQRQRRDGVERHLDCRRHEPEAAALSRAHSRRARSGGAGRRTDGARMRRRDTPACRSQ